MIDLCRLVIALFIFSCIGWLIEVSLKYIQYHRFINRGYLIGPYCPIYGCGVVSLTIIVEDLIGSDGSHGDVFLAGMVVCGALEYFVSWVMEKLYHARWWDYSKKPMNLNGRIWIGNIILFGIGSVIIIKLVNPILFGWLDTWPECATMLSAVLIVLLLIADNIISGKMMSVVKKEIDSSKEDNTEEISVRIREILMDKNVLIRRINKAYPQLKARPRHLTDQWKSAKQEFKEAAKLLKSELKLLSNIEKEKIHNANLMAAAEIEYRVEKAKEELERAKEALHEIEKRIK